MFAQKLFSEFRRHWKVHDKDKRIPCPFNKVLKCGATFYRMDVLKRHLETHKNPKFLVSRLVHSTFLNLLTILLVSPVTTAKKFSEVKRSWKSTKPKHIRQRATVVQSVVKILQRPMLSEFTAVQQRLRVS